MRHGSRVRDERETTKQQQNKTKQKMKENGKKNERRRVMIG